MDTLVEYQAFVFPSIALSIRALTEPRLPVTEQMSPSGVASPYKTQSRLLPVHEDSMTGDQMLRLTTPSGKSAKGVMGPGAYPYPISIDQAEKDARIHHNVYVPMESWHTLYTNFPVGDFLAMRSPEIVFLNMLHE